MEYSEQSDKQNKSVVANNEEVEDCAYMHSTQQFNSLRYNKFL